MNPDNPNFRSEQRRKECACDVVSDLYDLPSNAIAPEMLDFIKIIAMGAKKYELNGWLKPDGKRCSEKDMHDSMFHHLAESYAGYGGEFPPTDQESGLDPLLHLACRALMLYTRRQRGIEYKEKTPLGKLDDSNCNHVETDYGPESDGSKFYKKGD